jgi:putative FmdB family regulatory protein
LEVTAVPLYEYACAQDGRFEVIRKFSDPPLGACPTCGQPVEKLLSAPAIQFKGQGWYVTDYARKSESRDKDAGAPAAKDTGAKTEAGTPSSTTTASAPPATTPSSTPPKS